MSEKFDDIPYFQYNYYSEPYFFHISYLNVMTQFLYVLVAISKTEDNQNIHFP